ncbi:MAG: tRNA-specific 2-thiouridylase [Elusimicrobia bacterium]|nr:MAG: tRNA-specific 2-thiouridylase [Elusimicrobiota bacterium]KAF0156179.1 MAG: tRNA-specific 2-thiouridylase [Elusimicrobiota bacterium]
MSGGVDSSVACALALEAGYDAVGVTLGLFGGASCCGARSAADKAREVCGRLGVRHYYKNAAPLFKKAVIDPFEAAYAAGRTPNPCVACNRHMKFSYLLDLAVEMGAEALFTGHYARLEGEGAERALLRGADPDKDQSYFLYCIPRGRLGMLRFPLGGMKKTEVRARAAGLGLRSAREKESRDICFAGEGDYGEWLAARGGGGAPGDIVDREGKALGRHRGVAFYTVGQRRGLNVAGGERLYVTGIDPARKEVRVGTAEEASVRSFRVSGYNDLSGDGLAGAAVQIRYRQKPVPCSVKRGGDILEVSLDPPVFGAAPGQSAVFYRGDRVLGGGILEP